MFTTLLVANRGEIACRVIRTARAMGLRTVAVYSDPDADAPHVAMADEAIALRGAAATETYLNVAALLAAGATTRAEAVHPGYGFLSESPAFAQACVDAGLVWVGPDSDVIAAMGDKIAAKATMRAAGVPVLADAVVAEGTDLAAAAEQVGFPLLVKATAGGGGKGMRLVADPRELADAVAAARREAAGAFGDDRVFLERFVTSPRHVEVQILGDNHGTLVHLGERECSVQRRHQKIIEEAPSPAVDAELRARLTSAALAAAGALGYTNAGTVEFVLDADGAFHFLEVNTRLQVEHPVTELAWRLRDGTPLDLVRLQLLVAGDEALPFGQDDLVLNGHAIEARVYAEDPATGFLPSTGTLRRWSVPQRPGLRVDAGVRDGSQVSVHYDPMLAKVVAEAPTRREAAGLLAAALHDSRIHGVTTNRDLLVSALRHPAFVKGAYDTGFVEEHLGGGAATSVSADRHAAHAVAAALAEAHGRHRGAPLPTLPPGWRNNRSQPHVARYLLGDDPIEVRYHRRRDGTWAVAAGSETYQVRVLGWPDAADGVLDLELGDRRLRARVAVSDDAVDVDSSLGHSALRRLPTFPEAGAEEAGGSLRAPMPGAVVSVHTEAGARVTAGDLLVVLEAMKMEHRVTAPHAGTVAEVRVTGGDPVATGDVLVVMERPAAD
jgi:acetyl/propionyl-CoA carboxylase alpha subunit